MVLLVVQEEQMGVRRSGDPGLRNNQSLRVGDLVSLCLGVQQLGLLNSKEKNDHFLPTLGEEVHKVYYMSVSCQGVL